MRPDRGFSVAIAAAELSDAPVCARRMGAALFRGSRLLAVGANLYHRSHPASANEREFFISTHAEHVALLRRRHFDVSGNALYIARRLANGLLGNSKPCLNCQELCRIAGVKRIYYIDDYQVCKEIKL